MSIVVFSIIYSTVGRKNTKKLVLKRKFVLKTWYFKNFSLLRLLKEKKVVFQTFRVAEVALNTLKEVQWEIQDKWLN